MDKKYIKILVADQICKMLTNNVILDNGHESFVGWLEDGDIFANTDGAIKDEEIDEVMQFVNKIADLVDELSWKLAPENEED